MSEPYKFCYSCGAALCAKAHVWSYDQMTGKARTVYHYSCPNRSRFSFGHPMTDGEAYAMEAF